MRSQHQIKGHTKLPKVAEMAGPLTFYEGTTVQLLLSVSLQKPSGGYYDLTGKSVAFYVSRLGSNKLLMGGGGVIRDNNNGLATYAWPASFSSTGQYELQVEVTDVATSNVQSSQKLLIEILPRTARIV